MKTSNWELINKQSNNLAIGITEFADPAYFGDFRKYGYFSVILITAGEGIVTADIAQYKFKENSLLCFSLYQPFKIESKAILEGFMVSFHPEFFCLHKHRSEVSCNGVLFNNIYESPIVELSSEETRTLLTTVNGIKSEIQLPDASQSEMLLSYLKILLVNGTRMKIDRRIPVDTSGEKEPEMLTRLKEAIEANFISLHSAGEYAALLNISTAALNRISKTYYNKSLSELITERIIIEAKRRLYLSSKSVKMIAYELGFDDEFYFSRFFKKNVAISPKYFRDTVGFGKANA